MNNLFESHNGWTNEPCYYVVAFKGFRRAWLAGPYATRGEAEDVLPRTKFWAIRDSGDKEAVSYHYRVAQHYNGHDRSILGEIQPCLARLHNQLTNNQRKESHHAKA